MTYSLKLPPTIIPKDAPNNKAILNNKFAIDMLTGAQNPKSLDRAVRVGELMDTGLFELNAAGILIPKGDTGDLAEPPAYADNGFINSNFDVWQRNVSFSSPGFVADRWRWEAANTTGASCYRNVFTPGTESAVRGNPAAGLGCVVGTSTSATDNYFIINQAIEDVRSYNGEPTVVSFMVFSSAAADIALSFVQNFGVGGSARVETYIRKISLVAGWNPVVATFTPPKITGKTIGTNSFAQLRVWLSAGSTHTVNTGGLTPQGGTRVLSNMKIERKAASPYAPRNAALELMLCQRYYEKSYNVDVVPGSAGANDGRCTIFGTGLNVAAHSWGQAVTFVTAKRASPAVTLYSHVTGAANVVRDSVANADVGGAVSGPGQSGFLWYGNGASSANVNLECQWVADAEIG